MRGEYTTPGGKKVVVDFDVIDGRLHGVRVGGDFVLDPADALPLINDALEDASADATAFELEARVLTALPPEVEMLGASPQAVAEAVIRGLIGYGDLPDI
jgi:lipoate---protein ligase